MFAVAAASKGRMRTKEPDRFRAAAPSANRASACITRQRPQGLVPCICCIDRERERTSRGSNSPPSFSRPGFSKGVEKEERNSRAERTLRASLPLLSLFASSFLSSPRLASPRLASPRLASPRLASPRGLLERPQLARPLKWKKGTRKASAHLFLFARSSLFLGGKKKQASSFSLSPFSPPPKLAN